MIEITDEMVEIVTSQIIDASEACSKIQCAADMPNDLCQCRVRAQLILTAVAPLIAAAEREACAKIADSFMIGGANFDDAGTDPWEVAKAIRARPNA